MSDSSMLIMMSINSVAPSYKTLRKVISEQFRDTISMDPVASIAPTMMGCISTIGVGRGVVGGLVGPV